jgi:hypothetical protein
MGVSSVREFRDKATVLLKSKEPILITRRGRMAGIFFPSPEGTVSLDLNRQLFDIYYRPAECLRIRASRSTKTNRPARSG